MADNESPISTSQVPQDHVEVVLSMGQVQEQLIALCRPRVKILIEAEHAEHLDLDEETVLEEAEMATQETGNLLSSYWLQSIALAAKDRDGIRLGPDLFPLEADLNNDLKEALESGKGQLDLNQTDLEQIMQEFGIKLKESGGPIKLPFDLILSMNEQGFLLARA